MEDTWVRKCLSKCPRLSHFLTKNWTLDYDALATVGMHNNSFLLIFWRICFSTLVSIDDSWRVAKYFHKLPRFENWLPPRCLISMIQGLKSTGNIRIFGFLMGPKTPILLSYAVFAYITLISGFFFEFGTSIPDDIMVSVFRLGVSLSLKSVC